MHYCSALSTIWSKITAPIISGSKVNLQDSITPEPPFTSSILHIFTDNDVTEFSLLVSVRHSLDYFTTNQLLTFKSHLLS